MLYPVVFGLVLAVGGTLQWGAVILIMLGSQWYLLFNVAAGAQSIPADMLACARIFQLRSWRRWRSFISITASSNRNGPSPYTRRNRRQMRSRSLRNSGRFLRNR